MSDSANVRGRILPEVSLYDYDSNGNILYIGRAARGTAASEPGWYIEKMTYDANGNVASIKTVIFDYERSIWNNRTSLTYR